MRGLIWGATLVLLSFVSSPGQAAKPAAEPTPSGISVRMTFLGPVFVDAKGMTLYTNPADFKPNVSSCTSHISKVADGDTVGVIATTLPDLATHRSCADKNPALAAPSGAKPIGKWTLIQRDDGRQQWAYDGRPVYTSSRDWLPGDVNEVSEGTGAPRQHPAFNVIMASLPGVPPEVLALPTDAGLVYAYGGGGGRKPLYTSNNDGRGVSRCDTQCAQTWQPLQAAMTARAGGGDWSIITRSDGTRQWAYRSRPVYTYARDLVPPQIAGREVPGWQPIIISPPPPIPEGLKIVYTPNQYVFPDGRIHADSSGKTLYYWYCQEPSTDRLTCDQPGDSSAYWRAICGGPEKCAQTWKPVLAPANAKPAGGLWSVTTIDPIDPTRILKDRSEGVRVLTYRGRPLFTHSGDRQPGETNGKAYWMYDIADWYFVPAYGQVYEPVP